MRFARRFVAILGILFVRVAPAVADEPAKIIFREVEVGKLTDKKTEVSVVPEWGGRVIYDARARDPYRHGADWLGGEKPEGNFKFIMPGMREIALAPGKAFKVGTPSNLAAIAAPEVFLQKADFVKNAQSSDGAPGAELTAEYYRHNALGAGEYIEMELFPPLRPLREGVDSATRLHMLGADASPAEIEALLK